MEQFPVDSTLEGKKQLRALANLTLCHNHGIQARFKATEWKASLDHLPSTSQLATNQSGTNVPNSTHHSPPEATLQPIPSSAGSTAIYNTLFRPYPSEEIMTRPNDNNRSIKSEIYFLRKEIELLTARLAYVETDLGGTVANVSRCKEPNRSPVHSGIRSVILENLRLFSSITIPLQMNWIALRLGPNLVISCKVDMHLREGQETTPRQ